MTKSKQNIQIGFSLLELLVIIAIIGILGSLGFPYMTENIKNSRMKALSSSFNSATQIAQSEAIKRGVQVSIKPITSNGNQWEDGWIIFPDPDGDGTQDGGEDTIQTYSMDDDSFTLVSNDAVFGSWVGFLPSGAARGNRGISGGFRICRSDLSSELDKTKSRNIIIQGSGNVIFEKDTVSCS